MYPCHGGCLDLFGKIRREGGKIRGGLQLRLAHKIHRAGTERVEYAHGRRADNDNRHTVYGQKLPQKLDAVHSGHFDVQRYHIGPQLLDLLHGVGGIIGHADNLDLGVLFQHPLQRCAKEKRIVHDQNANFCHDHTCF